MVRVELRRGPSGHNVYLWIDGRVRATVSGIVRDGERPELVIVPTDTPVQTDHYAADDSHKSGTGEASR